MKSICLYFQVHQPYRLRTYRFFNIGHDHHYYDDYQNRHIIRRIAEKCYLPANNLMLELIHKYDGAFRISYSISGTALEQFQQYVPEVVHSFQRLADTGSVEFLGETFAHSLASLRDNDELIRQITQHKHAIHELFGQLPFTFRNSELIYSDTIGETVAGLGFHTMLAEGAKHVIGWKSPNYIYCNNLNPKLKVLLRNFHLSDDITFRFSNHSWSEWPLTAQKFTGWLNNFPEPEEVVNIFIDYETIGEHQWKETGIFEFFRHLPEAILTQSPYIFCTPEQLYNTLQPVSAISAPHAISWADEERDLTAWLGNELQDEAFAKLYSLSDKITTIKDPVLLKDWQFLQASNHFYYMCTKWFSAGEVHKYFNPYESPYEAFINYMNVLSDFIIRLDQYDPGILLTFKPEISEAAKKPARRGRPPSSTKKEPAPKTDRTKKEKKTVEKSETLKQPSQKRTKKK